jgi:AraC-like DNA-binding protein
VIELSKFDISDRDFNPTIFFAGKTVMTKETEYHEHDFAEITYILSGKGKYYINGETYPVQQGDIIMCNPGMKHCYNLVDSEEPMVEFCTGFTDFQINNMPPNSIAFKDGSPIMKTSSRMKKDITRHCQEMVAENEGCELGKYFMLKAHLIQILLLIIRENSEPLDIQKGYNFETYNRSYAVKRIIKYLNENYENKISLDQIAHNMYLSPVYISKIFKEETGDSPINYLIKLRLEKAKDIINRGQGGSIKEIANSVGYDDVYHFSKLFKKHFGMSPLYYKKSL